MVMILQEYLAKFGNKINLKIKFKAPHHYLQRTNYAFNVPSKYNINNFVSALSVLFGGHVLRVYDCAYRLFVFIS
jgi:hypothetical protein